jgi:hypothetical protein
MSPGLKIFFVCNYALHGTSAQPATFWNDVNDFLNALPTFSCHFSSIFDVRALHSPLPHVSQGEEVLRVQGCAMLLLCVHICIQHHLDDRLQSGLLNCLPFDVIFFQTTLVTDGTWPSPGPQGLLYLS